MKYLFLNRQTTVTTTVLLIMGFVPSAFTQTAGAPTGAAIAPVAAFAPPVPAIAVAPIAPGTAVAPVAPATAVAPIPAATALAPAPPGTIVAPVGENTVLPAVPSGNEAVVVNASGVTPIAPPSVAPVPPGFMGTTSASSSGGINSVSTQESAAAVAPSGNPAPMGFGDTVITGVIDSIQGDRIRLMDPSGTITEYRMLNEVSYVGKPEEAFVEGDRVAIRFMPNSNDVDEVRLIP